MIRKIFFTKLLIAFSFLLLISCGNHKTPDELVGVWEMANVSSLELAADGTAVETTMLGTYQRTWYVRDDVFCLVSDEGVETCGKYKIEGNNFEWESEVLGGTMSLRYTKISDSYSSNDKPANSLIGRWKLKYNNGVSPDGDELIMEFKSDGIVSEKSGNEKTMGIWTFCEETLSRKVCK